MSACGRFWPPFDVFLKVGSPCRAAERLVYMWSLLGDGGRCPAWSNVHAVHRLRRAKIHGSEKFLHAGSGTAVPNSSAMAADCRCRVGVSSVGLGVRGSPRPPLSPQAVGPRRWWPRPVSESKRRVNRRHPARRRGVGPRRRRFATLVGVALADMPLPTEQLVEGVEVSAVLDATLAVAADLRCPRRRKLRQEKSCGKPIQAKPERTRPTGRARNMLLAVSPRSASGATQPDAGRAAGCQDRTVRRRLGRPESPRGSRRKDRQVASRAAARISALAGGAAVSVLEELLTNPSTPPHIRLRAALGTLHMLPAVRDHAELEEMVSAISSSCRGWSSCDERRPQAAAHAARASARPMPGVRRA